MELIKDEIEFVASYAAKLWYKHLHMRYMYEKEDWIQEALLLLCIESQRFNEERYPQYSNNFRKYIIHRLHQSISNRLSNHKHKLNIVAQSEEILPFIESLECIEKEEDKIYLEEVLLNSNLTNREKKYIDLLLLGYSIEEIIEKDTYKQSSVYLYIQKAKEKMQYYHQKNTT